MLHIINTNMILKYTIHQEHNVMTQILDPNCHVLNLKKLNRKTNSQFNMNPPKRSRDDTSYTWE